MGLLQHATPIGGKRQQQGFTFFGLLVWGVILGFCLLLGMRVWPTVNEFFTIQRAVDKIAAANPATVQDVRTAFDRQRDIEYAITTIAGKDLTVAKNGDKMGISFAYNKEIEVFDPVFLTIKYQGRSK